MRQLIAGVASFGAVTLLAGPNLLAAGRVAASGRLSTLAMPCKCAHSPIHQGDELQRARAALQQGRYETAIGLLRVWLQRHASDAQAHYLLGRALLADSAVSEAREQLLAAQRLRGSPHPGISYYLGVVALRQQRYGDAEARFRETLRLDPSSVSGRRNLAFVLLHTQRANVALPLLETLVHDAPDDPLSWHYLGIARYQQGQFEPAYEAFNQAVQRDAALADARVGQAKALLSLARFDEAEAVLRELTSSEPGRSEPWFELGRLALRAGRVPEAIQDLERAVGIAPDHHGALYNLGLAYRRAGDQAKAEQLLRRARAVQLQDRQRQRQLLEQVVRDQAGALYRDALQALAAGQPSVAAAHFRESIAAAGQQVTAAPWLGLAAALLQQGVADQARDALHQALQIEPDLAIAYRLLAEAFERLGQSERAARARARHAQLLARQRQQ